ncbi:putative polysaccharide synthase Cps1 [Poronia punctata]|nr:putative polysaccharide synthase Cps1 [Poronia punctata]
MPNTAATALFAGVFAFRYVRAVVAIPTYMLSKPIPIQETPKYTGQDVSVVIPTTFKSPENLLKCLQTITACSPAAILIVTADANVDNIAKYCRDNSIKVKVLGIPALHKREQILKVLPEIRTPISVLADDDVFWPPRFLDYLLAVFEDPNVGAGGPRQRVRRNDNPDFWNFLGIGYLERRVWNNLATNVLDGSISTLSGRTAAYRTKILQSEDFMDYFRNDSWNGQRLNSDDDKCLTRYVYAQGWKIAIQPDRRATIETTVESGHLYIAQCLRWARAHWRGNFTVMSTETYWFSPRHIWGFYYIYASQFQTPSLIWDLLVFLALRYMIRDMDIDATACYLALAIWIFFLKIVKLVPHFCRYPQDLVYVPASILFGYAHGFLNVYSALTLNQTQWGSQALKELAQDKNKSG